MVGAVKVSTPASGSVLTIDGRTLNSNTTLRLQPDGGAASFGGRVALFVTRGSNAVGWKSQGFDGNIKDLNIDTNAGRGRGNRHAVLD